MGVADPLILRSKPTIHIHDEPAFSVRHIAAYLGIGRRRVQQLINKEIPAQVGIAYQPIYISEENVWFYSQKDTIGILQYRGFEVHIDEGSRFRL